MVKKKNSPLKTHVYTSTIGDVDSNGKKNFKSAAYY